METETQRAGRDVTATEAQACPSCGAALVDGMRFCRMCGYRLGEGMAEYVETIRFDQMSNMQAAAAAQGNQPLAPTGAQTTLIAPIAPMQPLGAKEFRRKGVKWVLVLVLLIVMLPLVGLGGRFAFRAIRDTARESVGRFQPPREQPRSFFGASEFGDTEGEAGAIIEQAMPGSPAERAGLVDGDIITKFDGTPVKGEDTLRTVLRETPIGKTVEIVYVRDGETKNTTLTTISNEDYNSDAFMPKERGLLGFDSDDTERVAIEGTKIHGVKLGDLYSNRPADLAGLKEGDIIVEFDGKPVRTSEGLNGYVNTSKPASTVQIVIYREGQRIVVPVKMGRQT